MNKIQGKRLRMLSSLTVVGALTASAVVLTQQSQKGIALEDLVLVQDELRPVAVNQASNVYLDANGQVHASPVDLGSAYLDAQGNIHAAPVTLSRSLLLKGRHLPKPHIAE